MNPRSLIAKQRLDRAMQLKEKEHLLRIRHPESLKTLVIAPTDARHGIIDLHHASALHNNKSISNLINWNKYISWFGMVWRKQNIIMNKSKLVGGKKKGTTEVLSQGESRNRVARKFLAFKEFKKVRSRFARLTRTCCLYRGDR